MSSAKRALKECCCILFTSAADLNKTIFKYTLMLKTGFYLQTKNWKITQEIKTMDCSIQSIEPIKIFLTT